MNLDEIQIDILESINNGEIPNRTINTDVKDKNGNDAIFVLDNLEKNGYIKMEQSNTGIGEKLVLGITDKGKQAIEE